MQITLEEFTRYLRTLQLFHEKEQRVGKALEEILDGFFVPALAPDLSAEFLKMLKKLTGDDTDFLGWWAYEKDFGRKTSLDMYQDDQLVPTDSIEDAYAYLAANAGT